MKYLTQNKHWDIVEEYNIDKLLYLLIDRPDLYKYFVRALYYLTNTKNGFHRSYDLPSYICNDNIYFIENGNYDRKNGKPAMIHNNGSKQFYINGKLIKPKK